MVAIEAEHFSFADIPHLARALREGSGEAFRFLHAQWNDRILRYCVVLAAGDEAMAMEIAQSTYLRIFHQMRPLPDERALWNWITTAMRSAAVDHRRIGNRYQRALGRFADWLRICREPTEWSAYTHLMGSLDEAVGSLDVDDRALIDARYFQREPLESIAARNGTTARAIEGRLARLRERLRTTITSALRKEDSRTTPTTGTNAGSCSRTSLPRGIRRLVRTT